MAAGDSGWIGLREVVHVSVSAACTFARNQGWNLLETGLVVLVAAFGGFWRGEKWVYIEREILRIYIHDMNAVFNGRIGTEGDLPGLVVDLKDVHPWEPGRHLEDEEDGRWFKAVTTTRMSLLLLDYDTFFWR